MLPHKTTRGKAAFERLKCLKGSRTANRQGEEAVVHGGVEDCGDFERGDDFVCSAIWPQIGWKHSETVKVLEAKRAEAGKVIGRRRRWRRPKFEAAKKAAEQLGDLKELIERTGFIKRAV